MRTERHQLREARLTLCLHHFKKAQMTKPMIKMATTRAASGLICNPEPASASLNTAPVKLNDDQIVLRSEPRPAYVI